MVRIKVWDAKDIIPTSQEVIYNAMDSYTCHLSERVKELESYRDNLEKYILECKARIKELESQQQPVKEEDKKACRSCPNCLSDNVIMFTSDLDLCQRCGQTF